MTRVRRVPAGAHLGYTTDAVEPVEHYLYRPLRTLLLRGRPDAYLTYTLIA
jgi:hypothetical protein